MNFKDQWAEDEAGQRYVFTVEMQRLLFEKGLPISAEQWLKYKAENAPSSAPSRGQRQKEQPHERTEAVERETDPVTGKFIGVFKNFNRQKGFGFIDTGDGDLYFNKKKALDDPYGWRPGMRVLYNVDTFRGKDEAIDVEEYD